MRATICELRNDSTELEEDFERLVEHVTSHRSEFVLLPEMPFYPWVAGTSKVDDSIWKAAVAAHDAWIERLGELNGAVVAATRPVVREGRRLNEGFLWTPSKGYQTAHAKVFLPDEEGFWEASWYEPGPQVFETVSLDGFRAGFLICTELWFSEYARAYGDAGAHLVLCPRATPLSSVDKWLVGGRHAAVVSGAFCLSSNRAGVSDNGMPFGGAGWAVEPIEGRVLGLSNDVHPFLTLDLKLEQAESAKLSYPRYVR